MAKPQGTFLRAQANSKSAALASDDKKKLVAPPPDRKHEKFFKKLDKISESKLQAWHKNMRTLQAQIKKSADDAAQGKMQGEAAKILGDLKKVLTQLKDYRDLRTALQKPAKLLVHAPVDAGGTGMELVVVIALCKVLQIFAELRRSKPDRE